jgi:hypothetical protein
MGRWFRLTASTAIAVVAVTAISFAFTLVVEHTKSGQTYKVNSRHAAQFKGFVDDYESMYGPIRGHLGCYSRWGHVRMSQHHVGNACDFGQYGWNRTVNSPMYRIGWLARKWGLRDGCSFRDCGHIDAGGPGWVNGGPAGLVAAAEIPGTRQDAPEVGKDHEWPRTLAKTQVTTHKPRFVLASLGNKPKPAPRDWLVHWNNARLQTPGWGEYAQLVDSSPTYFSHSGDLFTPTAFPENASNKTIMQHVASHSHKKQSRYEHSREALEVHWRTIEKEEAAMERHRVGTAGNV